jgi:hypothetical protein
MSLELEVGKEVLIVFPEDVRIARVEKLERGSAIVREGLVIDEATTLYGDYSKAYTFTKRAGGGWAMKGFSEPYLTEKVSA